MHTVAMVLGWIGALGTIGAYYLVSTHRFAPESLRYHALNLTACLLLAVSCVFTGAWPSAVANLLFMVVSISMTWRVRGRLWARIRSLKKMATLRHVQKASRILFTER